MPPSFTRSLSATSVRSTDPYLAAGTLTCDIPDPHELQQELAQPPRQIGLAEARSAYNELLRALQQRRRNKEPPTLIPEQLDHGDMEWVVRPSRQGAGRQSPRPQPARPQDLAAPLASTSTSATATAATTPPSMAASPKSLGSLSSEAAERGAELGKSSGRSPAASEVRGAYLHYRLQQAERELKAAEARVQAAQVPPQLYAMLHTGQGEQRWWALPVLALPDHCTGDDPLRKLVAADLCEPVMRGEFREQRFLAVRYFDLFNKSFGLVLLLQIEPGQKGTQDWALYNPQRLGPFGLDSLEPRLLGLSYAAPKRLPAAPAARKMYLALQQLLNEGKLVGRSSYVLRPTQAQLGPDDAPAAKPLPAFLRPNVAAKVATPSPPSSCTEDAQPSDETLEVLVVATRNLHLHSSRPSSPEAALSPPVSAGLRGRFHFPLPTPPPLDPGAVFAAEKPSFADAIAANLESASDATSERTHSPVSSSPLPSEGGEAMGAARRGGQEGERSRKAGTKRRPKQPAAPPNKLAERQQAASERRRTADRLAAERRAPGASRNAQPPARITRTLGMPSRPDAETGAPTPATGPRAPLAPAARPTPSRR